MKLVCLALALVMSVPVMAQEQPVKKKKQAVIKKKPKAKAHQKPTPEQIRKFNELQKTR